jgi:Pyridoxamine 5'-phosphate oxidase
VSVDLVATARHLLSANRYAVLATVDPSGAPWVSPVWFAHRGLDTLVWVSRPDARHSQAIAAEPRLAATVFDSTVVPGHGTAFYGRGLGHQCPDDEVATHLATFQAEAARQGTGEWGVDRVTGSAPFRLYVAVLDEVSLLLDDGGPDVRVPVELALG